MENSDQILIFKSNVNITSRSIELTLGFFINYSIIKLIFNKKYVYSKHKRTGIEIDDLTFIQFYFFFNIDCSICDLFAFSLINKNIIELIIELIVEIIIFTFTLSFSFFSFIILIIIFSISTIIDTISYSRINIVNCLKD